MNSTAKTTKLIKTLPLSLNLYEIFYFFIGQLSKDDSQPLSGSLKLMKQNLQDFMLKRNWNETRKRLLLNHIDILISRGIFHATGIVSLIREDISQNGRHFHAHVDKLENNNDVAEMIEYYHRDNFVYFGGFFVKNHASKPTDLSTSTKLGLFFLENGEFEVAILSFQAALVQHEFTPSPLYQICRDRYLLALAYNAYGESLLKTQDYQRADELFTYAINILKELPDKVTLKDRQESLVTFITNSISALNAKGLHNLKEQKFPDALKCFQKALGLYKTIPAESLTSKCRALHDSVHKNLAMTLNDQGGDFYSKSAYHQSHFFYDLAARFLQKGLEKEAKQDSVTLQTILQNKQAAFKRR